MDENLVLKIVHNETHKNLLKKAKDYIWYSKEHIIYIMVVLVYLNKHNHIK